MKDLGTHGTEERLASKEAEKRARVLGILLRLLTVLLPILIYAGPTVVRTLGCTVPGSRVGSSSGAGGAGGGGGGGGPCPCQTPKNPNVISGDLMGQNDMTDAPIKYFNGEVVIAPTELPSPTGDWFGYEISYDNQMQGDYNGPNGYNWFPTQMAYVAADASLSNGLDICIRPNRFARFSYNSTTSTYSPTPTPTGVVTSLVEDSANHQLVYQESKAKELRIWRFWDFQQTTHPQGILVSFTDPQGKTYSVTSYVAGQIGEIQRTTSSTIYSLLFTYYSSGVNLGRIQNVLLRNSPDGSSWNPIRQVNYTYYGSTDSNGSLNDLKMATVADGGNHTIDTFYYRYYTQSDVTSGLPGFVHGLKYVVNPQSYTRLLAANSVTDPSSLSNTAVGTYADNYFEYDSSRQATKEKAQGKGCSCSGGSGQGTFTYVRSTNTNSGYSNDFNKWKYKTVETLPNLCTNTVYSNYMGQTLMKVFKDTSSGNQWATFYLYDSQGNAWWIAEPSAVLPPASGDSYDAHNDLLNNQSTTGGISFQYLNNSSGLIHIYDYGTSLSATNSSPGSVPNYELDEKVQQGQSGTPILIRSEAYYCHVADKNAVGDGLGASVYPLGSETVYHDGTGAQTTTFNYTWQTTPGGLATTNLASQETIKPLISTGQNGPGGTANDVSWIFYDSLNQVRWTKDGDGYIRYFAYDPATGALTKEIVDVNTSDTSDFADTPSLSCPWTTPTGGGLHLITTFVPDVLGRQVQKTDPKGNTTYIVYLDTQHEERTYPGWQSGTSQTTGPVIVIRQDQSSATTYNEMLTMAPSTLAVSSGAPTGGEAISNIQSLSRQYLDNSGRMVTSDVYFNWGSLTYSNSTSLGTQNINFYRTTTGYDAYGRPARLANPLGTITRTVFDSLNRVTSIWVGTNDSTTDGHDWSPGDNSAPANMIELSSNQYDNGGVGDDLLTQTTTYVNSSSSDNRVTLHWYDWRDRQVASKDGVILSGGSESLSSENDGTHRTLICTTYDNLDRAVEEDTYDGDFVTAGISSGGLSLSSGSSSYLRYKTVVNYDDQNRVYQKLVYGVDQSGSTAGTVSTTALTTNAYFNHRGDLIEQSNPGGLVSKYVFDGAGRLAKSYRSDGGSGTGWSNASVVTGDNVLEETLNTLDANGNLTMATVKQHNHDDANTGELGNATTAPKARVSYSAAYFDPANRITALVDVGTNGGSSYTPPGSVPSRSDTALVTSYTYNNTGWTDTITDPKGKVTADYYDMMGRVTRQIEAYDGVIPPVASSLPTPTPTTDRATVYNYDGLSHITRMEAINVVPGSPPTTTYQATYYVYGASTSSGSTNSSRTIPASFMNSNDLLSYVEYPNPSLTYTTEPPVSHSDETTTSGPQEIYNYNAAGQRLSFADPNTSVHAYTYDVLGRVTCDAITTLGSGVDNSVLARTLSFDTGDRPYLLTTWNSATGRLTSNTVNQVQDGYNSLGQLTNQYQEHSGPVNTSTSLQAQYGWNLMAGGANNSNLLTMTYPNQRVLHYGYNGSTLDGNISRVDYLADDSSGAPVTPHLEDYSYLGLGILVQRAHGQPGVNLTYIQQAGDSSYSNDGGDQYTGLDRFGRVIDQYWVGSGGATDRFQYAYDRDSNALYKNNLAISGLSELYHANSAATGDNATGYDKINRVIGFIRGTLSASGNNGASGLGSLDTVSTASSLPSHSQSWSLDALGNWSSQTIDGTATSRTHNSKNEVTGVGSNSLTFDGNGNTTTDQAGNTYIYDAWNHLISVKNSGGATLAAYVYDAGGRRVRETHGSTTTEVYFTRGWQVIEERQGSTVTNQYVWSPAYIDGLVLRDDNSTSGNLGISGSGLGRRLYAQQDANWNTTALLNTGGSVQERFGYDPYGNVQVLTSGGTSTTDSYIWVYRHQGLRLDLATGIYAQRFRDYNPSIGRLLQQEPFGGMYVDGFNLFQYEGDDPLIQIDPYGLTAIPLWGSLVGSAAEGGEGGSWAGPIGIGVGILVGIDIGISHAIDAHSQAAYAAAMNQYAKPLTHNQSQANSNPNAASNSGSKGKDSPCPNNKPAKSAPVDTDSVPSGSYDQPNGGRTDIRQGEDHGAGTTHTHDPISNTDPATGITYPAGREKLGRPVTQQDIDNINSGAAPRSPPKGRQ